MLNEIFKGVKSVAIMGHVRPDGDCAASCMGLYNYIKDVYSDIDVDVYLEEIQDRFRYIKDIDKALLEAKDKKYDLVITLDVSDIDRIGTGKEVFLAAENTVCIDHHISNSGFARKNHIVPDASSTGEVLFYLFDTDKINKETAECLYTAIINDTGVFCYSNTTEKTMMAAAKLIGKGIDFNAIIREGYCEKTYLQQQILGRALLESVVFLDKKCIFTAVRKADMNFYNITASDLDGIVDQLKNTTGIECAIFLYEIASQEYKVSMRSNKFVDVSKICSYFGGGGHVHAAGCTMNGSVHDVINNLSRHIEAQLFTAY